MFITSIKDSVFLKAYYITASTKAFYAIKWKHEEVKKVIPHPKIKAFIVWKKSGIFYEEKKVSLLRNKNLNVA